MTIIKILIYTDTDKISVEDSTAPWSMLILRGLLEEHTSQFVQFELKVVNRHQGCVDGQNPVPPAPIRITEQLLEDVDEIWFFGWFQKNAGKKFSKFLGTDQNELDLETEVAVLEKWMNERGLGVLISGDHSSGKLTDPPASFICLGKALGHLVPRAGQLRKWDGPPNFTPREHAFSTLFETGGTQDPDALQGDAIPQKLELVNIAPEGAPPQVHRLFFGRDENGQDLTIDVLPDHQHEGEVLGLTSLDSDWPPFDGEPDPERKEPKPVVVALGHDKQNNKSVPVLAVYDGDTHKVGRIVADSSWHHFFDENLRGFNETGNPTLGLLGQFYRNLALYLAPLKQRQQISQEMVDWVSTHPSVLEEIGAEPLELGGLAVRYLSTVATRCQIAEMFHVETLAALEEPDLVSDFPTLSSAEASMIPPQELVLGSIVTEQFNVAAARLNAELMQAQPLAEGTLQTDTTEAAAAAADIPTDDNQIIAEGIKKAFRSHHARLAQIASEAKVFSDRLLKDGHTKEAQMAHEACITTISKKWTSTFIRNGQKEPDGVIEITERDGKLEGTHLKTGKPLKDVQCDGTTISFSRIEIKNGKEKEIKYKDATITVDGNFYIARGKFEEKDKLDDALAQGEKKYEGQEADVANFSGGDWEAEKPIA